MNNQSLQTWVGRSREVEDILDARQANLMCATMNQPATMTAGQPLPSLWHWIYFAETCRTDAVSTDGHAVIGDFMPPIDLPPIGLSRRMWAGGRVGFHKPLPIGAAASKKLTIKSISQKQGRSGPMCFVTLLHEIFVGGDLCLSEEKDIVYLEPRDPAAPAAEPPEAPGNAEFSRTITPSSVWLFRYSSLMFNGHRIHYDVDFCRDVEGYPDLLVHGPLLATLLAGLAAEKTGQLRTFTYRAVSPIFNGADFSIHGKKNESGGALWVANPQGRMAMRAEYMTG